MVHTALFSCLTDRYEQLCGMQALAALTGLTNLALGSSGFSCSPELLGPNSFSKLQTLELYGPPYPHKGHEFCAAMQHVTALTFDTCDTLTDTDGSPSGQSGEYLQGIALLSLVKFLALRLSNRSLVNTVMATDAPAYFAALQHCFSSMPELHELKFEPMRIKPQCTWAELACGHAVHYPLSGSSFQKALRGVF